MVHPLFELGWYLDCGALDENPDETLRHVLARNSGQGWSFSKIPSRAGQWELCPPGRVILEQFAARWRLLWVENGEKNSFFDFSRHFGAPPVLQFSPKFGYFWPKTWGIMWGFTPFLNWVDILPLRRSRPNLVRLVGNSDERRESPWDAPSRFGP